MIIEQHYLPIGGTGAPQKKKIKKLTLRALSLKAFRSFDGMILAVARETSPIPDHQPLSAGHRTTSVG